MKRNTFYLFGTILFVILFTLINNSWVLSEFNFFIFDDFGHFAFFLHRSLGDIYDLLPKQMYNDRPVGEAFLMFLYNSFGFNYLIHHYLLLLIHLINTVLVYFLSKKIVEKFNSTNNFIPIISALIFGSWTKSVYAVRWDSAIFDLLGNLLSLIFLNYYLSKSRNNIYKGILLLILYFLMLRTKESTILVPIIAMSIDFVSEKSFKIKSVLLPGLLTMFFYASYLVFLALQSNFMGFNNMNGPYSTSFLPTNLLVNIGKYLYIFLDITKSHMGFEGITKKGVCLISLLLFVIAYEIFKHKNLKEKILFLISGILFLAPVLPLVNMQHKLYLYMPSVFFSIFLADTINNLFKQKKLVAITLVISLLFYINWFEKSNLIEKNWWLNAGKENLYLFKNLSNLKTPDETRQIVIKNLNNNTSILNYGPGDVLRVYFGNRNLNIKLQTDEMGNDGSSYVLDYNHGKLVSSEQNP